MKYLAMGLGIGLCGYLAYVAWDIRRLLKERRADRKDGRS